MLAHLLHLFLYFFLHLFLPPCLHVASDSEPIAKKTKKCVPSAGADDASKKGCALGVVPQKQQKKRPSHASLQQAPEEGEH